MELYLHIIQRSIAKERGMVRYFTGKPCKHGHICERLTVNGACLECSREKDRQNYADNREKLLEEHKQRAKKYYARKGEEIKEKVKAKRAADVEKAREYDKQRYAKNKDRICENRRRREKANPEKMKARRAASYRRNKHLFLNATIRRNEIKRHAIPKWYSDFDDFVLQEMFELAEIRKEETGIEWHVDHMIPLSKGGLHWHMNWQLIPAAMNLEKHNKMELTEPLEWLHC